MVGCFQTTHLGSGGQLSFQAYRSIQYRRDLAFEAWCWLTGLQMTLIAIHNLGRAFEHEQNLQENDRTLVVPKGYDLHMKWCPIGSCA